MNAPLRTLTADQITANAVLESQLRAAHDTEVLLSSFIGSVDRISGRTFVSADQRDEARVIARHLLAHAAALFAVADGVTVEG